MANHLVVDTPMLGEKYGMATVTHGNHTGRHVCIVVEFSDGWCICSMGYDEIKAIRIEDMEPWAYIVEKRVSREAARKRWNRLRKILKPPQKVATFTDHLESATKIVESWPEWKKNVLTYSSQPERSR